MAAAALLRSMARKLARAPPPHPRPLLAGRIHGGAQAQVSGDRLAAGMAAAAAAAGLRSGAALPSLATKIARAPHHRHILNRGVHSSSTAPPTSDKDKIIEDLRLQLRRSRATVGIGGVILLGIAIYGNFWLLPAMRKWRDRYVAIENLEREVRDIVRADEDEPRRVALAQIIQTAGNMKQHLNGRTEEGTRVGKLEEEDVMEVCFDILKEAVADLKEIRADLNEFQAATDRMSKSTSSE